MFQAQEHTAPNVLGKSSGEARLAAGTAERALCPPQPLRFTTATTWVQGEGMGWSLLVAGQHLPWECSVHLY